MRADLQIYPVYPKVIVMSGDLLKSGRVTYDEVAMLARAAKRVTNSELIMLCESGMNLDLFPMIDINICFCGTAHQGMVGQIAEEKGIDTKDMYEICYLANPHQAKVMSQQAHVSGISIAANKYEMTVLGGDFRSINEFIEAYLQ